MEKNDLSLVSKCVVIGGSAGSLKVMLAILPRLSPELSLPVIIVLHRKNDTHSSLEELLNDRCPLIVKEAEDKEPLVNGTIYIAPPDYHLLVERDRSLSLDGSEKVLWSRPSIDVTFQSAAEAFGTEVMGILLSGANNDGSSGLGHIKRCGGKVVIQDPRNAEIPAMPAAALEKLTPDYLLTYEAIAGTINHFGQVIQKR